jgi:hypothetical protein
MKAKIKCGVCGNEIDITQQIDADVLLLADKAEQDNKELLELLDRFRSEVRPYCRPGFVKYDVFPVFKEVDALFSK